MMTTRARTLLAVLLAGMLAACGGQSDAPAADSPEESSPVGAGPSQPAELVTEPPQPGAPEAEPSQPAEPVVEFDGSGPGALEFLGELERAPTASEWIAENPTWADAFAPEAFGSGDGVGDDTGWCVRADVSESGSVPGVTVRRSFFFYLDGAPDPPADFSIPSMQDSPDYYLERCHLGLVTVETEGAGGVDQGAQALFDEFQEELGRAPRMGVASVDGIAGSAFSWPIGDATVGVGVRSENRRPVSYAHTVVKDARPDLRVNTLDRDWETEALELAYADAAMPPNARVLIDSIRAKYGIGMGPAAVSLALDLLNAAEIRGDRPDPGSPAADTLGARYGLLDYVFAKYQPEQPMSPDHDWYTPWPGWTEPMAEFGVIYAQPQQRGWVSYQRSLADSALVLTGPGGWADRWSLGLARDMCNGIWARRALDPLLEAIDDPRFRPRLHFLLGETYAAMVDLYAQGNQDWIERAYGRGDWSDPPQSTTEERQRALSHYAEAAATELNASLRLVAWKKAFAAANNFPITGWFTCEAF